MPALRLKIARSLKNVPWWVAPVFIAACFAYGLLHPVFSPSFELTGPYSYFWKVTEHGQKLNIGVDQDTRDLSGALLVHPHFTDTLEWWYNPWLQNVPYFRPLSMTLFWTQHKLFGTEGLLWFEGIHWFWHGLFLMVLWGFLSQIAGRGRAALAVGLFAAAVNDQINFPTGADAFNCWKDSVDAWAASFMVLAAWSYLRYLRGGGGRWWAAMLAAWLLNLTIKEAGYITPFILALVLWYEGKIRGHWKSLAPIFALAPCAWLYRSWALTGYGNKTGTGDAWISRFALDALGLPPRIVGGDWLALAPVLLVIGIGWSFWRREKRLGKPWLPLVGGMAGATICVLVTSWWTGIPVADTLSRLAILNAWRDAQLNAMLAAFWGLFLLERQRIQIFGLLWVWINFSPLIIQPPTSPHVYYPVAPGWSLLLACALWFLAERVLRLRDNESATREAASPVVAAAA